MSTKIYFGGSFFPPHRAHAEMVRQALKRDKLAELIIIPTKQNPLKESPGAPLELIQAWMEDLQKFLGAGEFSRCKLDLVEFKSKDKKTYTLDTLQATHRPGDRWVLLMGSDSAETFPRWREPEKILSYLEEIWIVPRGKFEEASCREIFSKLPGGPSTKTKLVFLEPVTQISSTRIRNEATSQTPAPDLGDFLTPKVLAVWKKVQS